MLDPTDPRFLDLDPCSIFLHGGCHVFAVELAARLAVAGDPADVYCLWSADGGAAVHMVVGTKAGFYDALGGPQTEATLKERYVDRTIGTPELVQNPAALTMKEFPWSTVSRYGHYIESAFLMALSGKAKAFITSRASRFGLPQQQLKKAPKRSVKTERPVGSLKLSLAEQDEWLKQHLPHRIRSVLPGIRHMDPPWKISIPEVTDIPTRSLTDSVNEGRHGGMRWLIFFVGIMEERSTGLPKKTTYDSDDTDVWIERLDGSVPFDLATPEAVELARLYAGCTKATGHPIRDTNHPPIGEPELSRGMKIILRHLQGTIYKEKHLELDELTLRMEDVPLLSSNLLPQGPLIEDFSGKSCEP